MHLALCRGGGLHGHVYRTQFGGPRRQQHPAAHQQQQPQSQSQRMMLGLVQLLPIVLMVLFSWLSGAGRDRAPGRHLGGASVAGGKGLIL